MSASVHTIQLRSSAPDVRNPLLKLASASAFTSLSDPDRRALRVLLDAVRRSSKAVASALWKRGRVRQAAYWRACSVYAGHAARLAHPKASAAGADAFPPSLAGPNPLLALPAVQLAGELSPAAAAALTHLLQDLREDAQRSSVKSWSTAKSPMASYWSDVATYAGHCARFVRARRPLTSVQPVALAA